MSVSTLARDARAELRAIRQERTELDRRERRVQQALKALEGGGSSTPKTSTRRKPSGPRIPIAKRAAEVLAQINRHPGDQFRPQDIVQRGWAPNGSANKILLRLIRGRKVEKVDETPRGQPVVQAKAGRPETPPAKPPADTTEAKQEREPAPAPPGTAERVEAANARRAEERSRIIAELAKHPEGVLQRDLAPLCSLEQPRLSELLKGMNGLVTRTEERVPPHNKPAKRVRLAAAGS